MHQTLPFTRLLVALLVAFVTTTSARAELSVSPIFSNGMVLQRDMPCKVWGTAAPDEAVSVTLADTKRDTRADADGHWSVEFPALSREQHPKPLQLSVVGDRAKKITIANIQLGEVWMLAGGERVITQFRALPKDQQPDSVEREVRIFIAGANGAPKQPDGAWKHYDAKSVRMAPATAYRMAEALRRSVEVPVGMIVVGRAYPETPLATWIRHDLLEQVPAAKPILDFYAADGWNRVANQSYARQLAAWREANQKLPLDPPPKPERAPRKKTAHLEPSSAYRSLIEPLARVSLRGIVWDHGENDHSLPHAVQYGQLLPALVESFRSTWQRPDLPFIVVQMRAGRHGKFDDRCGAELRAAQDRVLALPHTRSVVTLDLGPRSVERQIGERLARAAQAAVGADPSPAAEPRLKRAVVKGNTVELEFSGADGGLRINGEKPLGFAIASSIYRWVWADVKLAGNTITLSAPTVEKPLGVRYAYQDRPEQGANVYNAAGLPLAPFRTDDDTAYTAKLIAPDATARYQIRAALHIEDPRLPRVLIIGDSISGGYQEPLAERLRGKANLIGEATRHTKYWQSCGPALYKSSMAIKDDALRRYLVEREPFDVIHFNMGIHEFAAAKPGDEKSYAKRLRKVVEVMRANSDAKLIWCSSTGTISDNLIPRFPRYLSNCQRFNAAAEQVMQEMGVPINDLYGRMQPQIKQVISGDHIHFSAEAKQAQAEFLAPLILKSLP